MENSCIINIKFDVPDFYLKTLRGDYRIDIIRSGQVRISKIRFEET
jgi:hypothetical protein